MEQKLLLPPYTLETAKQKIKLVEDSWNSKNPIKALLLCSEDSEWHSGCIFLNGHREIQKFLTAKWKKEKNYQLKLKYWAHTDKSIAVQFVYEYRTTDLMWYRASGNETWEFNDNGLIRSRFIRLNDFPIEDEERQLKKEFAPVS